MFKKVYEEEFGIFGGQPFGAMIGDYEFSKQARRTWNCWRKVSQVAAAAHAPFLSAASPEPVEPAELHRTLDQPRDIGKIFDSTEYAKWKSFRKAKTRSTSA
jgi:type VI secretion system protein ImpC